MTTTIKTITAFRFGVAVLRYSLAMITFWYRRARQRRELGQATTEQLDDMGIEAKDAQCESRKPFWRN